MRRLLPLIVLLLLSLGTAPAAAAPAVVVQSPVAGERLMGNSVTVSVRVADVRLTPSTVPLTEAGKRPEANRPGEGHLHFMLDLEPLVVWDRDAPYTFTGVPAGDHRLTVELVNNDHSPLAPPVVQVIQFQVAPAMPSSGAGGMGAEPPLWPALLAPVLLLLLAARRR